MPFRMAGVCNVAVVLAVLVAAALWIELGNRTAIEPPQVTDYRPCADSDAVPYGARCIEFMMGSSLQDRPAQQPN
jgi:hypothetical protein